MTDAKTKKKPESLKLIFARRLFFVVSLSPGIFCCGYMAIMASYIFVADAWGESLEAEPYPYSSIVNEYTRSNSTYHYIWYCTTDSIDLVLDFYEKYDATESESEYRENHYSAYQIIDNPLTRLFTSIGTGWTDSSPDAELQFWSVTENSPEVEREKCDDGILIEIGSGYADS